MSCAIERCNAVWNCCAWDLGSCSTIYTQNTTTTFWSTANSFNLDSRRPWNDCRLKMQPSPWGDRYRRSWPRCAAGRCRWMGVDHWSWQHPMRKRRFCKGDSSAQADLLRCEDKLMAMHLPCTGIGFGLLNDFRNHLFIQIETLFHTPFVDDLLLNWTVLNWNAHGVPHHISLHLLGPLITATLPTAFSRKPMLLLLIILPLTILPLPLIILLLTILLLKILPLPLIILLLNVLLLTILPLPPTILPLTVPPLTILPLISPPIATVTPATIAAPMVRTLPFVRVKHGRDV